MFTHDVVQRAATADLPVDPEIAVALIGLQPVYARGLQIGLTAAGLRCTIHPAAEGTGPPHESEGAGVAVVPSGRAPAGRDHLRTVHALAEATPQAYADALRAGAVGAFASDAELADIARTVRCAALGQTLLPVSVARALGRRSVGPRPHVTGRELQYLRMLADGATVAGVGRRFGHSEREMYRLLATVYSRLGASNRTGALLLAQRFGMLDDQP